MKPIKLVARINWLEWADVRETDLTKEQVGDRDRDDRGVNSIIVMMMRWSGQKSGGLSLLGNSWTTLIKKIPNVMRTQF